MQEASDRGVSSGRDRHASQVAPDRHSVTVTNENRYNNDKSKFDRKKKSTKNKITIGTWNVRTMHQNGKLDNILQEIERMQIDILGISEMRWTGAGRNTHKGYSIIYSGGQHHERGVGVILGKNTANAVKGYWTISDRVILIKLSARPLDLNIIQVYAPTSSSSEEDLESFYLDIQKAIKQCKTQENTIVMGDFNAKIGEGRDDNTVGPYGLGTRNERGEQLAEWARQNDFIIGNTWFSVPRRRRWTWETPGMTARNQIDFILVKERFRNSLKSAKSYPGADCGSDHKPVIAKVQLKFRKLQKKNRKKKLDLKQLKLNPNIRNQFYVEVANRFEALNDHTTMEEEYKIITKSITSAAEKTIPSVKSKRNKKWMTDEILDKMEERRKSKRNSNRYKELDREIHDMCDQAKEAVMAQQ